MGSYELIMPKMGESVFEATIIKWKKNVGDKIEVDDNVLEIATDKVDSEIPAPVSGILTKKLFKENDVVQVGAVLALIDTAERHKETEMKSPFLNSSKKDDVAFQDTLTGDNPFIHIQTERSDEKKEDEALHERFYSPLVKSIAKSENIGSHELDAISGTGIGHRVTKQDVLNYIENREDHRISSTMSIEEPVKQAATVSDKGHDEIIEMDRMRKLIAEHMVKSKQISPHVTSFVEADVTTIVKWREGIKNRFEMQEGIKLTFTPIFIEAVAKAIKDFPLINVSVVRDSIIVHKDINIGMATALPTGNLIVPVIKNVDQMSLLGIAKAVNTLADQARSGKLNPDDVHGGTFTLTNMGSFGNLMGTPIINQPQAAILATGLIKKKPVVMEMPLGDVIAIRHMVYLSLSYDHRVVDGFLGGSFLRRVADYLESFDINKVI